VLGTMRLAGILDHDQPVATRGGHDRGHVGGLAVKMDRNDRLRPVRDRSLDRVPIDRERPRIDIDEHRLGTRIADGRNGCDERKGRRDDFVSPTHARREQREMQCARPGVDADAVLRLAIRGELALERRNLAAERELAAVQHPRDRLADLRANRRVLRLQIDEGNHAAFPWCCTYSVSPFPRMELVAASISSTTRSPRRPSVCGTLAFSMQSMKCAPSTCSASDTSSFGAHMSPVRYRTRIW